MSFLGSTLYNKQWVLDTLQNIQEQPISEQDLESLSEMSCDDEVATFLSREAKAHFNFLTLLIKSTSSYRIKELAVVILSNMLRMDFNSFRNEEMCVTIPSDILKEELKKSTDPYYIPALVANFQYLTMFNDRIMEDFDEETDQFQHNFDLVPNVLMIMASTLDPDLLSKSSRYLFSIVELASLTNDPMVQIGEFLRPEPLGLMNEALKQALEFEDPKSAFIIVETISNVLSFLEDETLEKEHSDQLCETLIKYLNQQEEIELDSVTSCAKICSRLWTSTCHLTSFEQISKMYLVYRNDNSNNEMMLDVIQQCLKHFVNVHSQTLLSDSDLLQSPILGQIVQMLATE